MLGFVARFPTRRPWIVVVTWIAFAAASISLLPDVKSANTGSLGDLVATDADAITAEERSIELFRFPVLSRTLVVQHRPTGLSPRAEVRVLERALAIGLGDLPGLESVPFALPLTSDVPSPVAKGDAVVDGRPTTALTFLFFPPEIGPEGQTALAEQLIARYIDRGSDGETGLTGAAPARAEQVRAITDALPLVELLTVLLITIAVGFHYRSPLAPLTNIFTVALAYLISLHLIGGAGQLVGISVPEEVEPVMVALLFGIVTDYSIFFLSRFRRHLRQGIEPRLAAELGSAELLPTIFVAGISVAAASAALAVAQLSFFKAFGPGMALAVLVALAIVTTFVPAVLAILGRRLFWPSLGDDAIESTPSGVPAGRFAGLLDRILALPMRRPLVVAVGVALPLLALAFAATKLELGNTLISGLPPDSPPREGIALVREGFEPGVTSPVMLLVEQESITQQGEVLRRIQSELSDRRLVASVVGPADTGRPDLELGAVSSPTGDAVRFLIVLDVNPLGSRAIGAVADLRDDLGGILARAGLPDADVSIAGDTAISEETVRKTSADLARVVPLSSLAVLLVLALFLRALIAPLYLVAASLLALAASLGLTVIVFQELLGFGEVSFFVPFAGVVLLIALGSDYNVYLVGGIWEEARRTPFQRAVELASANARTAITVAGLVLALSFALLAIVPLRPFRELGFLLASGLLIDAFVVRSLLAPALIMLVGERSAWPGRSLADRGS